MSIFTTRDYKHFIRDWLDHQPKNGRGLLSRMAAEVGISPAMITHVLSGEKHFSVEAANEVAKFIALSEDETDYFLLLVSYERAGTHSLRERLRLKIVKEQKVALDLEKKMKPTRTLPELTNATFYSNWIYAGILNLAACHAYNTVDAISAHLSLPRMSVQRSVDFLVQNGLLVIHKGKLETGPVITFLGKQNSLVEKHHQNWRLHGMTKMFEPRDENVFFTSPMSLSREAAELIRSQIPSFIESVRELVGPSTSEVVRCLNIDWFAY